MTTMSAAEPAATLGTDISAAFQAAYENRYTWDAGFSGYRGSCSWSDGQRTVTGGFTVGKDLKAAVEGIDDEQVRKEMQGQLWEVTIHRVRRSFQQTHGDNTFTAGDTTAEGSEVVVGGKASGDRYRIKNNVVTMVYRHIHGKVVTIHTESTTDTGSGYLSRCYTSRYSDPATGEATSATNHYTDTFAPLANGYWTLRERVIRSGDTVQTFSFSNLEPLA